jgi:alkylated DNA repair dioxygenase AlkB
MASEDEFNEAETFFLDNLHPFKFMNTLVTRRQCTFGKVQYARYTLMSDENKWPSLVHRVIQATQAFAAELGIANPEEYNAVHGNYYEDEGAGVAAHSDDEKQLVQKAPIFSYTFLKNDNNEFAREFVIKRKPGALHETIDKTTGGVKIILESGDLLVMGGDMQEHFTHELPKLKIVDENKYVPRINFTVRRFTEADPKKRGREY